MRKASGDNFTIDLEHGVAVVRIYRRSDLPVSVTDALADALLLKAKTLTLANDVTGMVLDLRRLEGPVSPRVEEIYGELCAMWESTGQPISLLAGSVVQRMQLGRLLSEHAPRFGGLFSDRDEARKFAGASALSPATNIRDLGIDRPSRQRG
jgi:hypothetical protein